MNRILPLLFVIVVGAAPSLACDDDSEVTVEGDVGSLLAERPAGEVELTGAFSRIDGSDDGGFEVVLCDRVGGAPDVPDVPPLVCLGERVGVASSIAGLDLDWTSSNQETVSDYVVARGVLDGDVFVVSEIDYRNETFTVP
ncbi:MAG: hypothetical protein AAGA42_22320 [Actinomycetota bacterium]